ncbi:RNA-binding protein 24 [Brachypodium distachyon]|uniref:RRM domain-containing protein n=1 Tax=Brachypodium distachyon TaxID=15368 RepID=I1HVD8_BRADI|nr:RNA-binding protein 24 [Brachypodium distachyon]KQK11638.1 hypothetical protein BRADI_2g61350v3 [Brachypodium distachyon]KQK11639.1 hypothetical protein BRADI_2g61350v3 [Brachypodium distachyon]|eukprot:XP_003565110.2 RNA-binding protein 24 [Brachypodium distachyon]
MSAQGDTTLTKLFVGGLAWETTKEGVHGYFEQFGEIAEAAVIADRSTGRSKGYGFVTFREAAAATRACLDPYPVIDGRRANCNLAYLGLHKPKQPLQGPYAAVTHVHGGGNNNTRAMKAAAIAGGGGTSFFPDHGIQQGIPAAAAYNVYGYSPYFSDYSYQPLTYYQAYGASLAGGAPPSYQVFNGAGAVTAMAADPTGLIYPYFQQYGPAAGYNMPPMVYQPQYAAAGGGAVVPDVHPVGQAALQAQGTAMAPMTAPALPQYMLVSSMPVAPVTAPDHQKKKPLSSA